jgi:hypothetical protein
MEWRMTNINKLIALGAIASFALVGCGSANGSNAPAPTNHASIPSNVLQFAVGTVNLFGTANGGLNVVTTYRQPAGSTLPGGSGTLLNSPTITLPVAIAAGSADASGSVEGFDPCSTAAFGSATAETTTTITSTTQNSAFNCGGTAQTTFGQSGGVFGLGLEPYNSVGQGDYAALLDIIGPGSDGTPFSVNPYPVPLWDTVNAGCATAPACDPNQLDAAWGGPPAIQYSRDSNGQNIAFDSDDVGNGISLGIDVFMMPAPAAAAGTYGLSVSIPANSGTTTASGSFALPGVVDLGTAGAAPGFVPDGTGGGTVTLVPPAGAWTEALVEVIDYPAAATAGGGGGIYYTLEAVNGGNGIGCTGLVCTLSDTIGPNPAGCVIGGTLPACTSTAAGDQIVTQVVYADYPIYELQYGTQAASSSGKTSPTLLGAAGSADLSISTATCTIAAAGDCNANLPLLHARKLGRALHRMPAAALKAKAPVK